MCKLVNNNMFTLIDNLIDRSDRLAGSAHPPPLPQRDSGTRRCDFHSSSGYSTSFFYNDPTMS